MDTYIIYVESGEVLGAAEADDHKTAAEAVVNGVEWPGDPFAVEVEAVRVTDQEYDVPDEMDTSDPAVEMVESGLRVVVHE
jgi:hypothetical protein